MTLAMRVFIRRSYHRKPYRDLNGYRITSYNVCYTKLLRSLDSVRLAMRHQDTRAPFLATLEAGEGGYGSLHLDGVRLKLHGEMARHTLELETDLSDGHARNNFV